MLVCPRSSRDLSTLEGGAAQSPGGQPECRPAARLLHRSVSRRRRCRPAPRAGADRPARCRCTATPPPVRRCSTPTWPSSATSSAPPGKNTVNPIPGARAARDRAVVPGGRRSVRARRLLPLVRRGRRERRRGLHHVPDAARRTADEGRQDVRGVRQGQHAALHVLPWTDRPLVTTNLVGGEERLDDAGISVARLIPNPWIFLEATGQVFRGDGERRLFQSSQRSDLSYVGHLRGYQDLTEIDEHRPRRVRTRYGHNDAGVVRRRRSRPVHDVAVRRRRDVPVAAAAALDLPLVRRPLRGDLEPPRSAGRAAERRRASTCPATTSSRAAGSRACASTGPIAPTTRSLPTRGQSLRRDLLAERVQPGARAVPPDEVRGRRDRERVPVPVPVRDRRARRASVLSRQTSMRQCRNADTVEVAVCA